MADAWDYHKPGRWRGFLHLLDRLGAQQVALLAADDEQRLPRERGE